MHTNKGANYMHDFQVRYANISCSEVCKAIDIIIIIVNRGKIVPANSETQSKR